MVLVRGKEGKGAEEEEDREETVGVLGHEEESVLEGGFLSSTGKSEEEGLVAVLRLVASRRANVCPFSSQGSRANSGNLKADGFEILP